MLHNSMVLQRRYITVSSRGSANFVLCETLCEIACKSEIVGRAKTKKGIVCTVQLIIAGESVLRVASATVAAMAQTRISVRVGGR